MTILTKTRKTDTTAPSISLRDDPEFSRVDDRVNELVYQANELDERRGALATALSRDERKRRDNDRAALAKSLIEDGVIPVSRNERRDLLLKDLGGIER